MKKSLYLLLGLLLVCGIYQACAPEELPGSIYGTVVDKATGEPIKSAGVELSPVGLKTVTGSEGQFEFTELDPGKYTLLITKTGYMDGVSHTIEVKPGQQAKGDVQIEKLPPALKVVDDNRQEINTLDFGSSIDDVSRSFSLFNDGSEKIEWLITANAKWIISVSKTEGTLSAGATQSLIITIDRAKLSSGENKTTVHITSNSGNKQLVVVAKNDYTTTVLNTYPVTDIRSSSATFNGEIITDGTPKYTERGFVYAKESKPTIDNCIAQLTCPLTNEKAYSIPVSGLTEGTNYYVRAYAVQAGKAVYSSNEVSFVATGNALAKVVTKPVSKIIRAEGKATLLGEITNIGDPAYTERGFVYSTTPTPSTATGTKIQVAGNTIGEYSDIVSSLLVGKIYYVRAYAINKVGVAYGEEQVADLTPLPPTVQTNEVSAISPDAASATFNATITDTGDPIYTERGFVYSKSKTPTTGNATKVTVSGTGEGNYSKAETGLDVNCMYYVRAFVIYSGGTVYGEEKSFTIKKLSAPTVTTTSPANIAYTSATVGGNVTSDGAGTVSERGVCYSTNTNPTTSDYVKKSGSGVGNYAVDLYGLSDGTTYYVRAYAVNEKGISYGEEKSFTTLQYEKPSVITNIATNIDYTSATVGGNVTADGGSTVTERGVCYSTSTSNPTILDNIKSSGRGIGSFTVNLTGLSSGATYYVRAYATNAEGISYGEIIQFTTKVLTYEAVDMGLSVKWATFNVGATKPEEYGEYFAWGETSPKEEYTWANYKHCLGSVYSLSKYNSSSTFGRVDNKEFLEPEDDAATINWGGSWRMPTIDEMKELSENCGWAITTVNGISGYKVTSYETGNSIFIPGAGYKDGSQLQSGTAYSPYTYIWANKSNDTRAAAFTATGLCLGCKSWNSVPEKCLGLSVRPVCP